MKTDLKALLPTLPYPAAQSYPFALSPSTAPVLAVRRADWPALLQQLQCALAPEAVASFRYYRDTAFAADISGELSDFEAGDGALADAAHYAAASKKLHTIVAGQGSPSTAETITTLLAHVKHTVPAIEVAQDVAKSDKDYAAAAEFQELRWEVLRLRCLSASSSGFSQIVIIYCRLSLLDLVAKAEALQQEHPVFPAVASLQRFSLQLQRHTKHFLSKKWFPRFFVLKDSRLYFSDGKNTYPDTSEGAAAFVRGDPAPDGRYCVEVRGLSGIVIVGTLACWK